MDDLPDEKERADWLGEELQELMKDEKKREQMKEACKSVARLDAASTIAEKLLSIAP